MNRQEAEKLVGKKVVAWTAANGYYVGELVAVLPNRPWRGRVRITGVLDCATPWEIGRLKQRRGFRPGEEVEVGGVNIKPAKPGEEGVSYLECLESRLKVMLENPYPNQFWYSPTVAELRKRIEEEAVAVAV